MSTVSRIRKPQQERSRESLERVMEAGMEVLIEDGWEKLTLARVCERAGVSVGMLYRRFRGREELLAALQDRWIENAASYHRELLARRVDWGSLGASEALRTAIGEFTGVMAQTEGATHAIGLNSPLDEEGLARLAHVSHDYASWFRGALLPYVDEIGHADPVRAIDFAFRVVLDMTIRRTTHGDDFDTGVSIGDWDAFALELSEVCSSYLFRPRRRCE